MRLHVLLALLLLILISNGCHKAAIPDNITWDRPHSSSLSRSNIVAIDRFSFEDVSTPNAIYERSQLAVLAAKNTTPSGSKYFVLFAPTYGEDPRVMSLKDVAMQYASALTPEEYLAVLSVLDTIIRGWDRDENPETGTFYEYSTQSMYETNPTVNSTTITTTNQLFNPKALISTTSAQSNELVPSWLSTFHMVYNRTSKQSSDGGSLFRVYLGEGNYHFAFNTNELAVVQKFYTTIEKAYAKLKALGMP